ncbi:MFS transporter [Thermaurantiacus sp.]
MNGRLPVAGRLPPLAPLFLVVFIGLMGFGVVLPVFPFWGRALGAEPALITVMLAAYSLGQFLGAPLWGRLSDRIGRRPALIASLAGSVLAFLGMAIARDVWALGAARLVGGLMAGNIAIAFAYVGDVTDSAARPRAMGIIGAAFALGFILGPAVGGIIAGTNPTTADFARVALVAAAITLAALVAVWFVVTESLPIARRREGAAGPTPSVCALLRAEQRVARLMLLALLVIGAAAMMETTFALFAGDVLSWSPREVGLSFGLIGAISAGLQAGAAAPLARRFGSPLVARLGILAYAVGLLGLSLADGTATTLGALAVTSAGVGLFTPAFQTLVADAATDSDRGLVNGLTQGASAMGRILGPAVSGSIYQGFGPASPFLAGAGLMLVALAVALGTSLKARPA